MIESVEQLKNERPDLVDIFESMDRDQLLNQCYLECIDALNMEERVSVFMEHCTINMSKTNYTTSALVSLINNKKDFDINEFCYYELVDGTAPDELFNSISERAKQFNK